MSHALARTSPKGEGEKFVGKCIKCGQEGLGVLDALQPCPKDGHCDEEEVLLGLITGELEK